MTLALFRYKVQEVLDAQSGTDRSAAVFAVPTVFDQPMSNVCFTAPDAMAWGHAVGLAPEPDCRHLAAELIHARMDYQPEHQGQFLFGDEFNRINELSRDATRHQIRLRRSKIW